MGEVPAELHRKPTLPFYRLWVIHEQSASNELDLENGQLDGTFYFCPPALIPQMDYSLLSGFVCWFDRRFVVSNPYLLDFAKLLADWNDPLPTLRIDDTVHRSCTAVWRNYLALKDVWYDVLDTEEELVRLHQALIIGYWHALLRRTTTWLSPQRKVAPLTQRFLDLVEVQAQGFDSITTYARSLYVSESTLLKRVKADLGVSPIRIIQARRIKRAQQQLITTALPIGHISDTLEYSSHAYFSEQFKQHTQMSPQAYRRLHRTLE